MDELRIPKRQVAVEVTFSGGAVQRVLVFLSESAGTHAGGEQLADLLNGPTEFIPAVDVSTGATSALQLSHLTLARAPGEVREAEAESHTIPTEHEVELTLSDGHKLRGLVTYVRPPERSRLFDYLNDAPLFFRLLETDGAALVNKRHVVRVEVLARRAG